MSIGVFDSGLGGLSVLRHLKQQLKSESFIYVADSAHAPYGDKEESFIQQRCLSIADFLFDHDVSAIVVACNTATAAAVEVIRSHIDIPVVAIEPALKPASLLTKTGKVGVLATASTLQSKQYKNLLKKYAENIDCHEQAAHGLVEQVEQGLLDNTKTRQLLLQYLQPMLEQGVDTIVLGCTHYPFLLSMIEEIVGDRVLIIDTGAAVAEQLDNVVSSYGGQLTSSENQRDRFFTSANRQHSQEMITRLLGNDVIVEKLPV